MPGFGEEPSFQPPVQLSQERTGATLQRTGMQQIDTASQAAQRLRPLAGDFTFALFALGIVGTGLLSVPVLAGSLGRLRGGRSAALAGRPVTKALTSQGLLRNDRRCDLSEL